MSDTRSPIIWNYLVDDLETVKYGKIRDIETTSQIDYAPEASSQVSAHSNTSRHHVDAETVGTLDHQRCFFTNESGDVEVAHLLDKSDARNGQLMDALRGLGVVHDDFNLGDVSNLLLMSRNLHVLWKKYAAFIIVPSTDTRKQMKEILVNDRQRIMLASENKQVIEPHQLAYPQSVTYDILLVRPSLFGNKRSHFQRADNHDDDPTYYMIPKPSDDLQDRLEYLTKQDDEAHVSEFLNIQHVTDRLSQQGINPYLMAMNALPKLDYWLGWGIGTSKFSVPDPVFTTAFNECERIAVLISSRMHGVIHMSRIFHDDQACRSEGDDEEETPSTSSRGLAEELESPVGSGHPHRDSSMHPGTRSWILRGNFDKTNRLENWRQEVSELCSTGQALNRDPE